MRKVWFGWASAAPAGIPKTTRATRAGPATRTPMRRFPNSSSFMRSRPRQRRKPVPRRLGVVAVVELLEVQHPILLGDAAAAAPVEVRERLPRLVLGMAPRTVVQDQLLLADEAVAVAVRHRVEGVDQGTHPRQEGIPLVDEGTEAGHILLQGHLAVSVGIELADLVPDTQGVAGKFLVLRRPRLVAVRGAVAVHERFDVTALE